ncbi:MAG: TetR/AcrR family transcriptional regulator, partial [Nitriliruptoraceae bacterium]
LNMQSAPTPPIPDDRTTPARIRDAAIVCFAEVGVAATPVRRIAEVAGVSPALVMHHFGSKDALRAACDQHVAAVIRARKSAVVQAGPGLDPVATLRDQGDGPPLLAYLARTLTDGSPHVAGLLDELVADAVAYTTEAEASGMLRESDDPRARAAVMLLWSLGAVVLHEHAERLLGVDLLGEPEQLLGYVRPAFEILGQGVFTPTAHAQMSAALAAADPMSAALAAADPISAGVPAADVADDRDAKE